MGTAAGEKSRPEWQRLEPLELSPILSAALDAFYEKGFHGASVRDIARRVGVTVPALYYHYDSKEGLLVALVELGTGDVLARARAADDAGDGDPARRLTNVVSAIVLRMTDRARLAAIEGEARYLTGENHERYRTVRKGIETIVLDIVRDGVASGAFDVDDPAETTRAVLGMCQAIPRWYHTEGKLGPEAVAAEYAAIAAKMVAPAR
ncbi:TetR/AcrR family transcriptional regulator [Prescottella sp. R16]|uniref:TetR/AcrR family transcriptional regulator n=1 Tax=Prescottella sp. R16 TaxID=3064529 RepID=UPI00272E336E|nr:TetR/AcrR family transcriptional regulator [Prescottella sp. R16]